MVMRGFVELRPYVVASITKSKSLSPTHQQPRCLHAMMPLHPLLFDKNDNDTVRSIMPHESFALLGFLPFALVVVMHGCAEMQPIRR